MNCPHVGTLLTLEKSPIALCLLSTFPLQITNDPCHVKCILFYTGNKMKVYLNFNLKTVS